MGGPRACSEFFDTPSHRPGVLKCTSAAAAAAAAAALRVAEFNFAISQHQIHEDPTWDPDVCCWARRPPEGFGCRISTQILGFKAGCQFLRSRRFFFFSPQMLQYISLTRPLASSLGVLSVSIKLACIYCDVSFQEGKSDSLSELFTFRAEARPGCLLMPAIPYNSWKTRTSCKTTYLSLECSVTTVVVASFYAVQI